MRDKKDWVKIIEKYSEICRTPFTVKDVQTETNNKIGIIWPKNAFYRIIKIKCCLSYKRISSRSKRFRMENLSVSRVLFWAKFLNYLTESTLIINIYETIFNKNCKSNYSWGLRGVDKKYQNENVVNSINMILALCSNGSWMFMILPYWNFIIKLNMEDDLAHFRLDVCKTRLA